MPHQDHPGLATAVTKRGPEMALNDHAGGVELPVRPGRSTEYRRLPGHLEWLIIFVALMALNLGTLTERPNWDAAMSIFRAAISLESLDFDLPALLAMPGYTEGGPNTHSLTIGTLITAVVLRLMGDGDPFLVTLHTFHLAFYALGFLYLRRLSQPLLGPVPAYLLLALVALHPMMRVQMAALYIDLPAALSAVIAVYYATTRAWARAALWLLVACGFKQSAIFVGGTVALLFLFSGPLSIRRAAGLALMLLPPMILAFASAHFTALGGEGDPFDPATLWINAFERYLYNVPDLLLLLPLALGWSVYQLRRPSLWHPGQDRQRTIVFATATLILFHCLFFYLLVPLFLHYYQVLIRYQVIVLPFLGIAILYPLTRLLPPRWIAIIVSALVVLEVANSNGRLYPRFVDRWGNDFSIAERSFEYRPLAALQRAGTAEIERIGQRYPVVHDFPEKMLMSDPLLGYADSYPRYAYSVTDFLDRYQADPEPFSRCLFFYLIYPWGGASEMEGFIQQAANHPQYEVLPYRGLQNGDFRAQFVLVRRKQADCTDLLPSDG